MNYKKCLACKLFVYVPYKINKEYTWPIKHFNKWSPKLLVNAVRLQNKTEPGVSEHLKISTPVFLSIKAWTDLVLS